MRRILTLFAAIAILSLGTAAHADTIGVYSIDLTVGADDGAFLYGTVSGSVFLDETTGFFIGANFDAIPNTSGTTYTFTTAPTFQQTFSSPSPDEQAPYFESDQSSQTFLILVLPGSNLIGYNGGGVCGELNSGCFSGGIAGAVSEITRFNGLSTVDIVQGSLTKTGTILQANPLPYDPTQGTDPLPATTPETSSFLLLGTGFLGAIAMARRRFS